MSFIKLSRVKTIAQASLLAGLAMALVACSDADEVTDNSTGATADMQVAENSTADHSVDPITTAAVDVPAADGDVDMDAVMAPSNLKDMFVGDENAPVTIVEYASMTCPHCKSFHETTYKEIKEKYLETGKARLIFREFPFDPRAAAAIMLARCAPEERFFPLIDVFFQQQSTWARAQDAQGALLNIVKLAGFTQESFNACLTNQQLLDDVTEVRNRAANDFGVQSTPTFIINGKRYSGAMSVESMSAIIDSLL